MTHVHICEFTGGCLFEHECIITINNQEHYYCHEHIPADIVHEPAKDYCARNGCPFKATHNIPRKRGAIFCKFHAQPSMVHNSFRFCDFPGCPKNPTFGITGTKQAISCGTHKAADWVSVRGGNKCLTCELKRATHNFPDQEKPLYCGTCAKSVSSAMVNITTRKCAGGCGKIPNYGVLGTNHATHCADHGKKLGLVDIKHCKCEKIRADGTKCPITASRSIEVEGVNHYFCAEHGKGIADHNKKCEGINPDGSPCQKHPAYDLPGATRARYCEPHAKQIDPRMINIKAIMCKCEGEKHRPSFNFPGKTARYCEKCKKPGMVSIDSRQCEHQQPKCTRRPTFGFETDTEAHFCEEHKQPGMINVIDNRCSWPAGCSHINPCFGFPPGYIMPAASSTPEISLATMRCKLHIEPGMIDIRHPRCSCPQHKRAIFFVPDAVPKIMFCFVCKPANAISENPICDEETCDVRATYGPLFEQARHCARHGKEEDDTGRRKYCEFTERFPRCQTEGCQNKPTFSNRDDNYPTHCPADAPIHAREIETGICARCTHPDLINRQTHLCIYCELGGDRATSRARQKRQEDMMNQVLSDLGMPPTTRDHVLPQLLQGGLKDRPDFHYDRKWFALILENDEGQHGNTIMIFGPDGIPILLTFPDNYDVPLESAPIDPVEAYKAQKKICRDAPAPSTIAPATDGASTSASTSTTSSMTMRSIRRVGYSRNTELARMIAIQSILKIPVIFIRYNPDEYTDATGVRRPKACGRNRYITAANYARRIMNKLPVEKPAKGDPLCLRGLYVAYLYYNGQQPDVGDAFHVDVKARKATRWNI